MIHAFIASFPREVLQPPCVLRILRGKSHHAQGGRIIPASFDAYKVFYFVGRYRNITRTANALFLSQSTVSRCIQNLETDLGCRLFVRSQNGVTLMPYGKMLYSHVARACEHIFLGEEKLRQMQRGVRTIRRSISEFFLRQFLMPVLADFRRDYPDVCVEITTHTLGTREEAMDKLAGGLTDLVCTMEPLTSSLSANIIEIASFEDVLIAGKQFSELREGSRYLADLTDYPFAALSTQENGPDFYDKLFAMQGMDVVPAFKVDTASLLLPLVRRGLCLAFIPEPFLAQIEDSDELFRVNIRDEMPAQTICIAAGEREELPQTQKTLIDYIRRYASALRACDPLPS